VRLQPSEITDRTVTVRLHRRAHLPILLASGAMAQSVQVPCWHGATLQRASR